MKIIEETARKTPVLDETEILVIGGGPAGLSAAIAAAREGADTILVDRYGCFGGVITQCMMGTISWYRYAATVEAGGLSLEFEKRAIDEGASFNVLGAALMDPQIAALLEKEGLWVEGQPTYQVIDPEYFKHLADKLISEAGVKPLLHCYAVDTILEDKTIKGVIVESKSGRQAILAKRVIDATGDADIAYLAGVPCQVAPKNELMETSVNFGCSGVDLERFFKYLLGNRSKLSDWGATTGKEENAFTTYLVEPFIKANSNRIIPEDVKIESFWGSFTEAGEIPSVNAVHMRNIDATDVWDLTKAEIEGRKYALWALNALKKYQPGFEHARLRTFGSSLGVRESRKIIGEYSITEEDVRNEARFDDSIGICPEFIDGYDIAILPTTGRYFQVPYGIIIPQKIENLLVAGRSVSGDKISHAATRQMVCCCVTGQAAGISAAVSLKSNSKPRDVNISQIQKVLKKQGVRIE
jgi:hypothetical protein